MAKDMASQKKDKVAPDAGDLPDGFVIDAGDKGGGTPPQADTGDVPPGFVKTDERGMYDKPQNPGSAIPHMIDRFKQGVAGTMALPALAVDASQAAIDVVEKSHDLLSQGAKRVLKGLGVPVSEEAKDAAKQWKLGNDPDKENFAGYKMAKRGIEAILRLDQGVNSKEVPMPLDSFGGPSKSNEYLGKIAEFAGSALIPGAGPVVAAQRKMLTAGTEMLGVTASAMSSVEAKEWGEHNAGTFGLSPEQGAQVGEMLGAVAGPKMITMAAQGLAKTMQASVAGANKLNITGLDAASQKQAAQVLMQKDMQTALEHSPASAENVARVIDIQKKIKDFQPNAAQATGAPGLIAMTKEVSKASPEALAKAAAVDARNRAAIDKFTETSFPPTKLAVNEGARAKVNTDRGIIQQDLNNVDRELTVLSDQYARSVDKGTVGQQLRDLYWSRKGEVKAKLDTQIADVYATANKAGLKSDMTDVRDTVKRIMDSDRETFQQAPGTWNKILGEFGAPKAVEVAPVQSRGSSVGIRRAAPGGAPAVKPADTEASFEKLHSLWKESNREWMDLVASGQMDKARKVSIVKDMLKQKVDKFNGAEYGQVGEKFKAFNQDYGHYAQTFKQGAGGTVGKMTKNGYSRDAEDLVDKVFLKSGDKSKGLEDFFQVYGRDEKAAGLLHDGILDNYSRAAVDKYGNFDAAGAAGWMKRNGTALKELPALSQKLEQTTDVAGALVNRRLELFEHRRILDKGVMNAVTKETRPELLVEAGMKDPRIFKALLASSKTVESKQAIARSIVDMAKGKNDSFGFVTENEKVLKPVMDALGKEHWSNLKTLAEAEQVANRVKAPTNVELSKVQDPAEQLVGTSGKGLLSRAMNAEKGYMSKPYLVADLAGRYIYKIRTEEMARLREAALFDPDMSRVLMKVATSERPAPKDLLDLKGLAYTFGISIASQAIATKHKDDSPEAQARPKKDPNEGVGKWR